MGHGYKGDTGHHHSIGENLDSTKARFKYNENTGYFGDKGQSDQNKVRNISSDEPRETAKEFYDTIANGGIEQALSNGKGFKATMSDGNVVTFREVSSSDGSPAVDINITNVTADAGNLKTQKIHFVKG